MANTLELVDKRESIKKQIDSIIETGMKETRKLSDKEQTELDKLFADKQNVETEIRKIDETNKKQTNNKEQRTMGKFSLLKAIYDVANNKSLDENTQNVVNEGMQEMRKAGQSYSGQIVLPVEKRSTISATVAGSGKENVPEDKLDILEPLRANLVMVQAGANYMSGLVGDVSIPVYSGGNVAWAGESAEASDGAGAFSEITLQPKRLTAYIDISKQFLIQDSNSAEELLQNDIVRAISDKLEATILGDAAGTSTQPAGLFNGVTASTSELTYKNVIALEEELEDKNVYGNICYVVNPTIKSALRSTAKTTGNSSFIMENNEINGLPVLSTSSAKGLVIGNFSDYVIGQWGGIDLTVDPYTQAANGNVRLVINAYFDAKPRRADSFVKYVYKAA